MARVMIVAGLASSLVRFRGDLIDHWLQLGHNVIAAGPTDEVKETLEGKGVNYYRIPLQRTGLNPVLDLYLLFKLIFLIRRLKPDYLFLYTVKPVIYGSIAAYTLPECRVFSMITGLGSVFTETAASGLKMGLKNLVSCLYRLGLRRNERVFFQNPDDVKLFTELAIVNADRVTIINGSGVNIYHFKPADLPVGNIVFLLIGRLLQEKGIAEYFEAAKLLKAKYTEAQFKLVGWQLEGGASAIKQEQVERWNQLNTVEVYGFTDDVRPYIEGSSVYVLPSYREGTPRTVLEAMAMGRPIITSDAPGCRETVEEGVNGFLVPVRDVDALAEAMERFIRVPELVAKMGAESRRIAEEKYDVHKVNAVINQAMGLK